MKKAGEARLSLYKQGEGALSGSHRQAAVLVRAAAGGGVFAAAGDDAHALVVSPGVV